MITDFQPDSTKPGAGVAANDPERRREERALIERCQSGDHAAFGILVERYTERVRWICLGLVGDREDAKDLAQEAFLRVFRSIDRFRLDFGFYTWLYRIAVNLCIDHLRRRNHAAAPRLEETPTDHECDARGPFDLAEVSELGERIQRTLQRLPAKYRAVIVLRDVEGLGSQEIASIIGCTHATMRWRLHRARELFREAWKGVPAEEEHPAARSASA